MPWVRLETYLIETRRALASFLARKVAESIIFCFSIAARGVIKCYNEMSVLNAFICGVTGNWSISNSGLTHLFPRDGSLGRKLKTT